MSGSDLKLFLNGRVTVKVGDITKEEVDAVVNAANSTLLGGGGVDGAIHRAGGPEIKKACEEIRRTRYPDGLHTSGAVLTTAGRMPARYVIHTVGPVFSQSQDRAPQLAACYTNSLALAAENALATIAFPAISTGIYSYPREAAAEVASTTIERFLQRDEGIREVRLVFFQAADAEVFVRHQRFSS